MRNKAMNYFTKPLVKPLVISALASLALLTTGCAEANPAQQTKTPDIIATSTSSAPVWTIQPEGSHIRFSAKQEGETFTGEFTEFSGTILFDIDALETSAVDISIPLKSVEAGSQDRNSTLPGKVWFSVKKFPDARFTSNAIIKQDAGFLAKGELILKGKSVPLDLPFDVTIDAGRAVMTGQVVMDRTLWNVGAAPWDTDEWVSREVSLDLQVTADRAK